jgi:hypothetical protein
MLVGGEVLSPPEDIVRTPSLQSKRRRWDGGLYGSGLVNLLGGIVSSVVCYRRLSRAGTESGQVVFGEMDIF